ncbi:hypothetical protein NQ314_005279 [Rhamnusium bicolor]|uniref:Fatty acid synthase n=1 Tax=Rhamnusium bicolor TaxID=1586634 RepID=A0AAV8ZJA7_9CUCU|nr:hypothetical protein NQ314_005279 [Rhamnusium bicolor]
MHFSLYEYGYHPQLEKLYPTIDVPVSRGRNLLPITGYLYLAWKTLALSLNDQILNEMRVAFENCKFTRATTLPSQSNLQFRTMIQKGTGNFEIIESELLVASGRIYQLEDDNLIETTPYLPTGKSNADAFPLTTKDIYKELRVRGYDFQDEFRSIQECDHNFTKGYIKWNNNWMTFMHDMILMKILQSDTRLLYVPTYIAKITINSPNHLKWINDEYTSEGKSPILPTFNDSSTGIISCGGIQIWGLITTSISRKKDVGTPVLESYKFVPNFTSLSIDESVKVNMQIILENTLANKIKVVELIDDHCEQSAIYITPIILRVLEDELYVQPLVKILSKTPIDAGVEVENKKLTSERDCLLVVGTNILKRPEVLKDASVVLKEKGFILSRESRNIDVSAAMTHLDTKFITVITVHRTPTESLVLLQIYSREKNSISFKISSSNNFSWVPKLKEIIDTHVSDDIVIYSEKEPNSGILGLIKCLRKEPNGQNIRCIFIMDTHNEFLQNTSLCANQLKNNMAVNIYKNGQWGTYRHLLLNKLNDVKREHCFAYVTVRGDLSSIKWIEGPLRHDAALDPQDKLVYVYYAALNYRDIMIALGKIGVDFITKDRKEQECVQGLEFSGRDERGNRIMGMVNTGALSTLVLPDPILTFKVPDYWTLAEAATVPAVYLTVLYALCIRGEIKRSETILIHSGAGGIGLAAIHLALHHGCTVFTTVGSQDKRIFLKKTFPQLDEHHIGNSRDESFVEMILKGTKGRGVDVVLNFLAEEKLLASVKCLARGGKFIEIGKCDLASNNQLNLLLFKKNASFQGVMLDMLFKESPHRKLALSKLMNEGIQSGAIKPLTRIIFKFSEVEQAFRFMASSKHIGKILVQIREPENETDSLPSIQKYNCTQRYLCDSEMVYIIVGGLGGFGLELADWLVLRGAKKLVLNSQNGISTGYQNFRIRIWESYGTIVKISKCNIVSQSGCQQLIKESQELGSIAAVFNLAVVLSDSIFENQTPESFYTVFAPKAFATQYLDEVTRKMCPSLRDFVVFSSVTCSRGQAGQTNYGMANSVVERICETRKRDGYPGLAIQWGLIGDVGVITEKQEEQHIKLPVGGTLQQKNF